MLAQVALSNPPVHVYELSNPLKIAFMVDHYKKANLNEILRVIYENKEHPWNNNIVYLETDQIIEDKVNSYNIINCIGCFCISLIKAPASSAD